MARHYCSECGKRKACVWNLISGCKWGWTCWDCLEADEDGYVIQLD